MSSTEIAMATGVIALWLAAGGLALSETALTRVSRIKAHALAEEKKRGSAQLLYLVQHPERFLTPVLLLVLLCHLVAATLVAELLAPYLSGIGLAAATLAQTAIVFVFCESGPKTWAVQHSERAALFAAPIVRLLIRVPPLGLIARALIVITNVLLPGKGLREGPFVSEEELLATVDEAHEGATIESDERMLIHSIIEFGDTVVREVLVPRTDMVAVEGRDKADDVLEVAMTAGYSRIPVYEQSIDDIIGILYTKDLMRAVRDGRGEAEVRALTRDAHFVPETKGVRELMREMQHEKFHMAIVADEYGGTEGLVTLEDLIEELVGEIVDEFDTEETAAEQLPDGAWVVGSKTPVDEVNELLDAELPQGDWDTIGGLVFNALGHVPAEGEAVDVDGHRLVAERVQGRRIGRVRITALPREAAVEE